MTDHLNDLRATINRLDDEILALVQRRMTLAGDIIAAKQGRAAYRPGREAAVIERLAAAAPDLPRQLVANVWRQLMTASTALQDGSLDLQRRHLRTQRLHLARHLAQGPQGEAQEGRPSREVSAPPL